MRRRPCDRLWLERAETREPSTDRAATDEWGSYPADTSLDAREVVEAYVEALDERDGEAFCRVVAPWISGRFDLAGTDPDASLSRPARCPEIVPALTDFPWENQERDFKGASIAAFGDLEERGALVSVPVRVTLHLEEWGRGTYDEPLEDVVWLTRDSGALRVAKLSLVAAWASLAQESERDSTAAPDVAKERRTFAAEVAKQKARRQRREESYGKPSSAASCRGANRYADGRGDVVDYRHPAPPTPTPQLPAANIQAVDVEASDGQICVVFEMAGELHADTTFKFAIESPDFEWGRAGFSQGFEVELRGDDRARVSSGLDDERRSQTVPAEVGRDGNRLRLVLDSSSFAAGHPYPGSREQQARPLERFRFLASVTVVLGEKRHLHDDLGSGPPEGVERFAYP